MEKEFHCCHSSWLSLLLQISLGITQSKPVWIAVCHIFKEGHDSGGHQAVTIFWAKELCKSLTDWTKSSDLIFSHFFGILTIKEVLVELAWVAGKSFLKHMLWSQLFHTIGTSSLASYHLKFNLHNLLQICSVRVSWAMKLSMIYW